MWPISPVLQAIDVRKRGKGSLRDGNNIVGGISYLAKRTPKGSHYGNRGS